MYPPGGIVFLASLVSVRSRQKIGGYSRGKWREPSARNSGKCQVNALKKDGKWQPMILFPLFTAYLILWYKSTYAKLHEIYLNSK